MNSRSNQREFFAEEILIATGREPWISSLNLEAAGVRTGKDGVEINEYLQTTQPNIYAGGDVDRFSTPLT